MESQKVITTTINFLRNLSKFSQNKKIKFKILFLNIVMYKMISCNIYKITSPKHEKMYIGSTFRKLQYRFAMHKSIWNKASSKDIIQAGDAKIELVETIQVNEDDKRSRYLRERYWINIFRDMGCPIINEL